MATRRVVFVLVLGACSGRHAAPDAAIDTGDAGADAGGDAAVCPPAGGAPATTAGSRLHPVHWTSPDGLDVPAGVFDTAYQRECNWFVYSASMTPTGRCWSTTYPTRNIGNAGTPAFTGIAWLDAACSTDPVYLAGPDLAHVAIDSAVGKMIALGDELLPRPAVHCAPFAGASPWNDYPYHAYRIASTTDDLVMLASVQRRGVTAHTEAVFFEGTDGSKTFSSKLIDVGQLGCDQPIDLAPAALDVDRWAPPPPHPDLCTVISGPIATVNDTVRVMEPDTSCKVWMEGQGYVTVPQTKPGAAIPSSDFDPAPTADVGGSRLVVQQVPALGSTSIFAPARRVLTTNWGGSRGFAFLDPTVHDNLLGIDCRPDLAADGTTRCLPPEVRADPIPGNQMLYSTQEFLAPGIALYSDASCAMPIIAVPNWVPLQAVAPRFSREPQDTFGSCSRAIYSIGAPLSAPATVYGRLRDCGACEPISMNIDGFDFFAATEAAPEMFAPISVEVR